MKFHELSIHSTTKVEKSFASSGRNQGVGSNRRKDQKSFRCGYVYNWRVSSSGGVLLDFTVTEREAPAAMLDICFKREGVFKPSDCAISSKVST